MIQKNSKVSVHTLSVAITDFFHCDEKENRKMYIFDIELLKKIYDNSMERSLGGKNMSRIRKKYIFLLTCTFFLYMFTVFPRAAPSIPRAWIDFPIYNSDCTNKDVVVSGWALHPSGVKGVSILVNDIKVGQARIGISRSDVYVAYPGYPDGESSGFTYTISKNLFWAGNNKITIEVEGNNGDKQYTSTTVKINKPLPKLWIDSPGYNQTVDKENVNLSGWALNISGIQKVNVVLNGIFVGNATIGQQRTDVNKAYPGYTNGENSGYNFTISNSSLIGGKNSISVEAVGNDGYIQRLVTYVEKKTLPPKMIIDYPRYGETFNNQNIVMSGWAVNNSGIGAVKIYIDNVYKGDAAIGQSRSDVGAIYKAYPQADKSGFSYTINSNSVSVGNHTITAVAIGNDGSEQTQDTYINFKKPEAKMWIDSPTYNQVVEESDAIVSGWALNPSGVDKINVYMDGNFIGNANLGISREDVNKVYPGYPGGSNSGYNYIIPNNSVGNGNHTITVEVIGKDGSKSSADTKFQKKVLPSILWIDYPGNGYASKNSNITVSGWTLNRTGIKNVNIYVDSVLNGSTNTGILRTDVGQSYNKYIDALNSGYSYSIDVNYISPGFHNITVESVGKDGSVVKQDRTIQVIKRDMTACIDSPVVGYTIKGSNVSVSGWILSDTSVKQINVMMDGVLKGNADINLPRPDVDNAYPGYRAGINSGFSYTMDTSTLGIGGHTVSIHVICVDGTTKLYQVPVQMYGLVNYVGYSNTLDYYVDRQFNNGGNSNWDGTSVTRDQIAYYMNPDNFINQSNGKYMFLKLSYTDGITVDDLNKVLSGKGILQGKGSVFLEAGRRNNINPIYLVAHALLETGNGSSQLANGVLVTSIHSEFGNDSSTMIDVADKKTYNMFGIGAYDRAALMWGSEKAYSEGWFTVDDAIIGGAAWIGKGYIASSTYKQNTLYKMKWNFDVIWHEYATDIGWAYKQTNMIKTLVDQMDNPVLCFEVPSFKK